MNALGRPDDQDVRPADKETGLHDTGDEVQGCFQFTWPIDAVDMNIKDKMTSLGFKWGPVALSQYDATLGERFNFARGTSPPKGDNLDRQREGSSEHRYLFGVVDHHDELFRRRRDDLFL